MTTLFDGPPQLDVDLFSTASLLSPFEDYRRLRDAAPLVRLKHPDVYAIGRFSDVQKALRSSDVLISGEGVGFNEVFNSTKGQHVLQSDGELHRRLRMTLMRPLSPAALRPIRGELKAMIVRHVATLKGQGWFDAMRQLAPFLPVEAVSHLVGLPEAGRERMLEWASATFNSIGPEVIPGDAETVREAMAFMAGLHRGAVRDGSWTASLFEAVESGRLAQAEAMAAIIDYVIPSLDTTILSKGHLLNNFASHPDQWALLRERPDLIPSAVLENVRRDSIVRWFSRVATADYQVDGLVLPAGARVMLLYGCANRDERRYVDPDRFDITRDSRDHVGWGTGVHICAGMHMARLEMEVMLEALLEAGARLQAGEPTMGTNRGLYGFASLPLRID